MNENNGAIRDASVLGVPKMLILGLQHMFAMFGATILVPILVNSYFGEDVLHVQVTLICAGVGTWYTGYQQDSDGKTSEHWIDRLRISL